VYQTRGACIQELLDLIPEGIRDPLQIPKAIILYRFGHIYLEKLEARLYRVFTVFAEAVIPCPVI